MKKVLILLVFMAIVATSYSQVRFNQAVPRTLRAENGNLALDSISKTQNAKEIARIPKIKKAGFSSEEIQIKTKAMRLRDSLSTPIAFAIPGNINLIESGKREKLSDGGELIRLNVSVDKAPFMLLVFDKFYLPKGSQLMIFNPEGTFIMGPLTEQNNRASQKFMTGMLKGSELVLEYYAPKEVTELPEISIEAINAGFNAEQSRSSKEKSENSTLSSYVPAYSESDYQWDHNGNGCYMGDTPLAFPENTELEKYSRAAAQLILYIQATATTNAGMIFKNACALRSTEQNCKDIYLATNAHCWEEFYSDPTLLNDYSVIRFNWVRTNPETSDRMWPNSSSTVWASTIDYSKVIDYYGTEIVASTRSKTTKPDIDLALIKMLQKPVHNLYLAGWDAHSSFEDETETAILSHYVGLQPLRYCEGSSFYITNILVPPQNIFQINTISMQESLINRADPNHTDYNKPLKAIHFIPGSSGSAGFIKTNETYYYVATLGYRAIDWECEYGNFYSGDMIYNSFINANFASDINGGKSFKDFLAPNSTQTVCEGIEYTALPNCFEPVSPCGLYSVNVEEKEAGTDGKCCFNLSFTADNSARPIHGIYCEENGDLIYPAMQINDKGESKYEVSVIPLDLNSLKIPICISNSTSLNIKLLNGFGEAVCSYPINLTCTSCCDNVKVKFTMTISKGAECCWKPVITIFDNSVCPNEAVTVKCYDSQGKEIIQNSNGEICLPDGKNTIKYKTLINGVECDNGGLITLTCEGCSCPPQDEMNRWVSLNVEKGGSACLPEQCALTGKLNVPDEYAKCYSGYSVTYVYLNKYMTPTKSDDYSSIINPISAGSALYNLPTCLDPGFSIQVEVTLHSIDPSKADCKLYSMAYPCVRTPIIPRSSSCMLNDPNDAWIDGDPFTVKVNGCVYTISYQYRTTSSGNQDVQFTQYESADEACATTVSYDDIVKVALPIAVDNLIKDNPTWKPQENSTEPCVNTWRFLQKSCWSKWHVVTSTSSYYVYNECESDCCARQLRVCNYGGKLSIQDIGIAAGGNYILSGCKNSIQSIAPDNSTSTGACFDGSCNTFENFYAEVVTDRGADFKRYLIEVPVNLNKTQTQAQQANDEIILKYQTAATNDLLKITVETSAIKNIILTLYNIKGENVGTKVFNLNGKYEEFETDISKLLTGTYVYTITNNERLIGTGKFQVIR